MHALGAHQQPRVFLELPVGGERHPEGIELSVVRMGTDAGIHGEVLSSAGLTKPNGIPNEGPLIRKFNIQRILADSLAFTV
jgi:hypothetical protein